MFELSSKERIPEWLAGTGAAADVVISTRVRLARNLFGMSFPHQATSDELKKIRSVAVAGVLDSPAFTGGWQFDLEDCSAVQRRCLLELHMVSPALLRNLEQRTLLVSKDMSRCVMINEEDHLRLQNYRSGFDPETSLREALEFDDHLEQTLDFAYNDELGYLTTCPTNVGTGLRLSVLIHLPGLVLSQEIEKILNSLRQLQFVVRGLFGEGSTVRGALFQISNLVTLGRSEAVLTQDFKRHVGKVIQHEQLARDRLYERDPLGIQDMCQRSLAVLRSARLITAQETFDRLSQVRMGVSLGVLPGLAMGSLNQALVRQRAGHLQLDAGQELKGRDRMQARAGYLRRLLAPTDDLV